MSIQIHQLQFDPADPGENQRVGSFIIGAGGAVITETGTALDVNIASSTGIGIFAEDSAASSGNSGQSILAVRQDTLATDTSADGDYSFVKVNAKGELYVHDADVLAQVSSIASSVSGLSKIEDAAHVSGDSGIQMLSVRRDADTSLVSADGDYAPLQVTALGKLKVQADILNSTLVADDAADAGNPLKVGGRAVSTTTALGQVSAANDRFDLLADLYRQLFVRDSHDVGWQKSVTAVGATASQLDATALVGRKTVIIQNVANNSVWIGNDNTVTVSGATRGVVIPKNASMEFKFGEALEIWAIAAGAGNDVLLVEAA